MREELNNGDDSGAASGSLVETETIPTPAPSPAPSPAPALVPAPIMISSTIETEWLRQFQLLQQYKDVTGHTNVPNDGSMLYLWTQQQHRDYTSFIDILEANHRGGGGSNGDFTTISTSFNEEKLMLLRRLGFIFRRRLYDGSSQKRLDNRRERFDTNCELLKEFRNQFGHVEVPVNVKILKLSEEDEKKYRSLGTWLSQMRCLLRKTKSDPEASLSLNDVLTPDRAQRLDDIGISMEPSRGGRKRVAEEVREQQKRQATDKRRNMLNDRWDARFEEMKSFSEEHGHSIVPAKGPYSQLRGWLEKQRKEYRKLQEGQESEELTAFRLQRLADIGFQFHAKRKMTFDERFEQWVEYREQNGGKDPLRFDGNGLGKWISMIRAKKLAQQEGKKNNLTQDQIDRLNSRGFVWSVMKRPERTNPRLSWAIRFEDLKRFKAKHGHTSVPQSTPGLGAWVHKQRVKYWEIQRGRKDHSNYLSQEKIVKLDAVGFEWVSRQRKHPSGQPKHSSTKSGKPKVGDDDDDEEEEHVQEEDAAMGDGDYDTDSDEEEGDEDEDNYDENNGEYHVQLTQIHLPSTRHNSQQLQNSHPTALPQPQHESPMGRNLLVANGTVHANSVATALPATTASATNNQALRRALLGSMATHTVW